MVHFEIPANNSEKLSAFYKSLFGWKFEKLSMGQAGDYLMIETKTTQESPGSNGGMMKKMNPDHRPVNYVSVESVDEFSNKLQNLGGKIVMPKTAIGNNMGAFAICLDPEGNPIGLYESSQ